MSEPKVCPVSGESILEEIANAITHGLGLLLSIAGLVQLVCVSVRYEDPYLIAGCSVYGTSLVLLYTASSCYHSCRSVRWKRIFKIIDHACIFLLIAGTYTPITLGPLKGTLGWALLATVWGITAIGVPLKAKFIHKEGFWPMFPYLAMSFLIVAAMGPLLKNLELAGVLWIFAGGAFYVAGSLIYLMDHIPFNHSIWHVFVIGGSACHYVSIIKYVVH